MGCGNSKAVTVLEPQACKQAQDEETSAVEQDVASKPTLLTGSSGVVKVFGGRPSWHEAELGMQRNQIAHIFYQCDKDRDGCLTWPGGEVHDFIQCVFRQHGLVPPSETRALELLEQIGCEANESLDEADCVRLVGELFSKKTPATLPPFQARKSFELTPRIDSKLSRHSENLNFHRKLSDGWRQGSDLSLANDVVYESSEL
mmetsp:Transcript_85900/g.134321  ORF Transcript_85900/g.134321 Transcript_85900/m.134321 type:complete len:202 (-) Transcript_85900:167-772(-)